MVIMFFLAKQFCSTSEGFAILFLMSESINMLIYKMFVINRHNL